MRFPFQNNYDWRYTTLKNPKFYILKSKLQSKRAWIIVLFGISSLMIFLNAYNYGKFKHFFNANLEVTGKTWVRLDKICIK